MGPEGMFVGETARCFATLTITSIPLSLLMLAMLRYVARLSLFHPLDATVLILLSNFGVTALLLAFSGLYGRRLFEWVAR